ncbi:MAG: ATP-binding protein, partial [Planctomycetota bacterium]
RVLVNGLTLAELEEALFRTVTLRQLARRMAEQSDPQFPLLLAFDEAQYSPEWWRELKGLVDQVSKRRPRIVLTGSASPALLKGMEDSLQGRYDRFPLLGLNLDEFIRLREGRGIQRPPRAHLEDYLERGGYPEHATEPSEKLPLIRRRIREDVEKKAIGQDLAVDLGLREDLGLLRVFLHLVQHPGARLNMKKLSEAVGIHPATGQRWLLALEKTSLFHRLPATSADGRPAQAGRCQPKIYPTDPGLIAAYTPTGDHGRRAECAVLRHLLEVRENLELDSDSTVRSTLGFWKQNEYEIDFLLRFEGQVLAVEVTTGIPFPTQKLLKFQKALGKIRWARAMLVCLEPQPRTESWEGGKVEILPLEKFLLLDSRPRTWFPEA